MKKSHNVQDGDEILEVVDKDGNVLKLAKRSEVHSDPSLIHRVVHVLVFDRKGSLLLQRRSLNKDVAPGKWDTSVGGHVNPGEDILEAAKRETSEELGISQCRLDYLYTYLFSNRIESELVSTFSCEYEGKFSRNEEEIEKLSFWNMEKIIAHMGKDLFSNHFEKEIRTYLKRQQLQLKK